MNLMVVFFFVVFCIDSFSLYARSIGKSNEID